MAANIMNGKALAQRVREGIRREVEALRARNVHPGLAVVLVGENPASQIYVRNKRKACEQAGIASWVHERPADLTQAGLLDLVKEINQDPRVHGILVQLPLPAELDEKAVIEALSPEKDVDGFHPYNAGRLLLGDPLFVPCTPLGILHMLEASGVPVEGEEAVIVGRSAIVGKPTALLLLQRHATVTLCHSRTRSLAEVCRRADILVAAVGRAELVRGDWVKPGAAVVDVGVNRLENGRLVGDVAFAEAAERAGWISPVPGGVGPMTIAMLLKNTVAAAKRSALLRKDG